METITIINKSGKVVSTGKHLVNIFREAKEAYTEKKAALHAEHNTRIQHKSAQKLLQAREETRSVASSRHSRSSHRSHSHKHKDKGKEVTTTRPALTERNLSIVSEGSIASSGRRTRRSSSHHGEHRTPRSPTSPRAGPSTYRAPFFENGDLSQPSLVRRHTDFHQTSTQLTRSTQPPPYTSEVGGRPRTHRSSSVPDIHAEHEHVDMNLAYGHPPLDLHLTAPVDRAKEAELTATMSKLDTLLLEAHCLQHSATAIISNLQSNPEAMAAVALTLAELSNILAKMSPGILTALKTGSPAIFALLASPQFLIAGGVAIGVTVVMFGGFKIIKKLQANAAATKEANRMDTALVYEENIELGSIDSWRRGIAEAETMSVGTSVDGEFITPEAMRQKKERIRERAREERIVEEGSVRSERTLRRAGSESTIRRRDVPARSSSQVEPSETGRTERTARSKTWSEAKGKGKGKEGEKKKKSSAISVLFKKKDRSEKRESEVSHRPKLVDL